MRFASATWAGTRILFGTGAGVFTRTGAPPVLRSISLSTPPGIPPTTPPGTPPTSPPAVSTGGEGASCGSCTAVGILRFVGEFLEVNVGTGSLVTLEAAGAGGTYKIVTVSRLGSVSVRNSGMRTSASKRTDGRVSDPTAAQCFRGRDFAPDTTRLS